MMAHLSKLYIEPTNRCNLACRTCMRHAWDEPMGSMSSAVYRRLLDGIVLSHAPTPTLFFGG
jgi:MoaA/NifB/PqqE/SkfB family radical SAM enzyme